MMELITKKSMYQIRVDHLQLMQLIEECEGELTPEIEQALILTQDEFNEKALSYALVVKHFEDEEAAVEKEIKRLQKIHESAKKRMEIFKQRLADSMIQFGVEKIETPTLKISFRKSESVEIEDEDQVPAHYKEQKISYSVSKTKIKEAIKEGIKVPGATLIAKKNLQIK